MTSNDSLLDQTGEQTGEQLMENFESHNVEEDVSSILTARGEHSSPNVHLRQVSSTPDSSAEVFVGGGVGVISKQQLYEIVEHGGTPRRKLEMMQKYLRLHLPMRAPSLQTHILASEDPDVCVLRVYGVSEHIYQVEHRKQLLGALLDGINTPEFAGADWWKRVNRYEDDLLEPEFIFGFTQRNVQFRRTKEWGYVYHHYKALSKHLPESWGVRGKGLIMSRRDEIDLQMSILNLIVFRLTMGEEINGVEGLFKIHEVDLLRYTPIDQGRVKKLLLKWREVVLSQEQADGITALEDRLSSYGYNISSNRENEDGEY